MATLALVVVVDDVDPTLTDPVNIAEDLIGEDVDWAKVNPGGWSVTLDSAEWQS